MYFKKITMHGFKSFADPVTIEFDRGITCVVGPNGSGKSNVSDALRWVLGEQSPKMLRGGKMDEVIFAGTDARKSRGMAEVSLIIDNSDSSLPIDFAEVSITRRMYRSGESEYFINDSQCRLRDIRELIMDTGIGVDGYSIIGQGKISEIINGKPESRREIFEEAAGIVKYRNKKSETERKLEATTGNLDRVNDIISELEGRVEPLRIESEKAKRYIELSKEYKDNEINVILKNIETTEKNNAILENDIKDLEKQILESEQKKEQLDNDIRRNKTRSDELDQEDYNERERMMNASYELNELKNSIKVNNERISSLKQNSAIYGQEIASLNDRLRKEETNRDNLLNKQKIVSAKSQEINKKLKDITNSLDTERSRHDEKTNEFNTQRDRIYDLSVELSSKTAEISGLENMQESLLTRRKLFDEEEQDDRGSGVEVEYKSALRKYEEFSSKQSEVQDRLSAETKKLQQYKEKEHILVSKFEETKSSLQDETTKKEMLEQLEASYEGYNYAVKFIMRESGLTGIYGTVGELLDVPRGYETAIETALGARVQNIICKDDISADNAIRMLKTRRAGRLTFLPAESMRVQTRRREEGLGDEPGFVGIAADCVNFDAKYKKVMEYLLGGIVIVKTLDNAVAISKKYNGFRYVTIEGEFINPAGAITGGAYKNNNSAGILDRRNRLNQAEKNIFQYTKEKTELESELNRLRENINITEKKAADTESESRDLELKILTGESAVNALKTRYDEESERIEKRGRDRARTEQEIERTSSLINAASNDKRSLEAEIDSLKRNVEILAAGNEKRQQSVAEMSEQITSVKIEAETVRGENSNLENLINRANSEIEEIKKDVSTHEQNIKQAQSEQASLEYNITQTEQEIQTREQNNTNQNDRLSSIKTEKAELSKNYDKLLNDKEENDKVLYTQKTTKYDISLKFESGTNRIDTWKNNLWDEFEISYLQALELKQVIFVLNDGLRESRRLKNELKSLGDVNISSIEEYDSVKERYEFLSVQRKDLNEAIDSLTKIIKETDILIRTSFKSSFDAISANFENIFVELFGGGKAELRISQDEDPLEADIDIIVQPPGKKLQNMNLLSGGEKTMTAIALMFGVLKAKPTPFCILDEVEAALDEANIERFADYLKNFEEIQFVLVTHQKVTMEHANVLYGVTMPEKGISKVLSLKLDDAEKMEGLE